MATISYLSARYLKGNLPNNVLYYTLSKLNAYARIPSYGIRRPSFYRPHPLPYPWYTSLAYILDATS
jgi:hypothetical protein